MGKIKTSKTNFTIPGPALKEEEFIAMVKEAEKGPFYNMQETAQIINKWKLKYAK